MYKHLQERYAPRPPVNVQLGKHVVEDQDWLAPVGTQQVVTPEP